MAENWDGDMGGAIKQAQSAEEWDRMMDAGTPAWCYHSQNPESVLGGGKLYNAHVLNGSKKSAAPRGLAGTDHTGRDDAHQVL